MAIVRRNDCPGCSDCGPQQGPRLPFSHLSRSKHGLVLSLFLAVFAFCLSIHLHAQGYPTGEPIVGDATNVLASSKVYFDSSQFAGATLDVRVAAAQSACPSAGCTIDSRAETSCAIAATITFGKPVHWMLPYCTMSEGIGATIVISGVGVGSSITCDQLWTCILDGSSNGSMGTVNVTTSDVSLVGFKVLGGRMGPQTGTEVLFSGPALGPPITDCIADTLWVLNAGAAAVNVQDCNNFQVKNSVIEKSAGAGIAVNANNGAISGLIADNQLYDAVVNSAVSIASINISSVAGQGATSGVVIRGNHIIQGNLGPSNINGPSGGWQGTVTISSLTPTIINLTTGTAFLTGGIWNNWHILIAGQFDEKISSVSSGSALTIAGGFPMPGNYPALIYAVPTKPSYQGCGGKAGKSVTVHAGGTALTLDSMGGTDGNSYGFSNCTFAPDTTNTSWNNWHINLNGAVRKIMSCSSTTACTLFTTATAATYSNWTAYPDPADTDTGGGRESRSVPRPTT